MATRLLAADGTGPEANPNWAERNVATATASSYVDDPPWGYRPINVMGRNLYIGWQTRHETSGAWLEVKFPEVHPVSEIWIQPRPLTYDIVGRDPYMMTYSRLKLLDAPRRVRCSVAGGVSVARELPQTDDSEIIALPRTVETDFVHITVEEVWAKPGGEETGLGRVQVYPHRHEPGFEIDVYGMYDAQKGKPI